MNTKATPDFRLNNQPLQKKSSQPSAMQRATQREDTSSSLTGHNVVSPLPSLLDPAPTFSGTTSSLTTASPIQRQLANHEKQRRIQNTATSTQTFHTAIVQRTQSTQAQPTASGPSLSTYEQVLQAKEENSGPNAGTHQRPNQTGLPDNLKAGVENLSGYSLDDVRVHYNSNKPADVQALAYAQGTDIHVAPGQEQHLPHEAWHVVQQKQGRVQPTVQMKGTVNINDDAGLEKEADVMGAQASQMNTTETMTQTEKSLSDGSRGTPVLQGYFTYGGIRQRYLNPEIVSLFQGSDGFLPTLQDYQSKRDDPLVATDIGTWFYSEIEKRSWDDHSVQARGELNLSLSAFIGNYATGVYNAPVQEPMLVGEEGDELGSSEPKTGKDSGKEPDKGKGAKPYGKGNIRFANLDVSKPKYLTKANDIIDILQATPGIQNFLRDKNTLITLEYDPQLASVRIVGDQVQITLSPWFFEQESRGRILGMLAHEFGVHPLADEAMSQEELDDEQGHIKTNTPFPTGVDEHSITPQEAGQHDHVFAAVIGQPRFTVYRQTVYDMVSAMLERTKEKGSTVTEEHVTDAIMTYLSDVAMILATNDHRGKIVKEPSLTAECFNLERDHWFEFLEFFGGKPNSRDLVRLTPPEKTKGDVLKEVGSIGGSFALSMFTGSTSGTKTSQGKTEKDGVAPITPIQQEVLGDYGLALGAMDGPQPNLFDALDGLMGEGPGMARLKALMRLVERCGVLEESSSEHQLLQPICDGINKNKLPLVISEQTLNVIAWALGAKIRVIQPNGKIMIKTYGDGPLLTLLQVDKPAPHYRFAQ